MKISTLFLDIGGVLLTNGWGRKSREAAAGHFGFDLEDFNNRHHETFDTYEVGKISLSEYLQRAVFFKKRPFTLEQFRTFMFRQSKPYPDMIDLIERLKAKYGLKVVVVNNEGRELNEYRIKTFKLKRFVDFFVTSSYVRLRKPDADIYRLSLDAAQVLPSQVLYIDDRPMFVQVAKSLGIRGICHTSCKETRAKLARYGLS